ncbi:MAG: polysaccharide pyruvyl transferase family protein [Lachnospiraceae bacterium]|nr:polysaccharide pyruvyl transferase family protein [Lachnospiraceae bacterium]
MIFNRLKEKIETFILILMRNKMILTIVNYPAKRKRVNLHWFPVCRWSKSNRIAFKIKSDKQNLGDWLALPIYEYMTNYYKIQKDKKVRKTKHLYTIGSLIMMGYQDATVWGSGILYSEPQGYIWKRNTYRSLDVRCVRGPESLRRLKENGIDVSSCGIGDPGVLMPLIYQPREYDTKREYAIIKHMSKKTVLSENEIDIMTNDWEKTIDEIYNSKLVISSSLHGIILAEAYGIPAIMLDDIVRNDRFKYNDYYYSTGRYVYPIASSVEEALQMQIPEVPDLSQLKKNLFDSFPVDLWQ